MWKFEKFEGRQIVMKWNLILCVKEVALLQSESNKQFVVAFGYDPKAPEGQQWSCGHYFMYNNDQEKLDALQKATGLVRARTDDDLIALSEWFDSRLDKDDFGN